MAGYAAAGDRGEVGMSKDAGRVHEANMRAALESSYAREQFAIAEQEMPFDRLLMIEDGIDDGEDPAGRYEYHQRLVGVKALFRYILAEGNHPLKIMKRLYAAGAGFREEAFSRLTMEERALMFGETKAAVSWRMKALSGLIDLAGMRGTKLPGQKSAAATANYSACQAGNSNRKKKRRRRVKA